MKHVKGCLEGFYMSLGMFSAIPLPFHIWDERRTPVMIAVFPLIGLIAGALWWLASAILFALDMPIMLSAAILTITPFFIAGFIHLDGYMDTADALLSYRPLEEKMRILKDPNVGAFAVVMLAILFIMQFAAMHALAENREYPAVIIAVMVVSRCCSALCIFSLPHMPGSSYAPLLARGIGLAHKTFVVMVALAAFALSFIYAGRIGAAVLAATVMSYTLSMLKAYRGFKGISGDLLGFALVISELCGFIALAVLL